MAALPPWLVEPSSYEPLPDRDRFLRKNVLSLASVLTKVRADASSSRDLGPLDRLVSRAAPGVRLAATLALVACVSLARNMAFVWVAATWLLVVLALRPAERIRAVFLPAAGALALAVLVNLPALLLGQTSAPLRMGAKTFVTVGLMADVAQGLGVEGILAALRSWRLPERVVMTLDLALRDIVLLGESAHSLSEALALRSVGRDRTKTGSAAGVMGVTFLHAHTRATARAEAMELRGYGSAPAPRRQGGRGRLGIADLVLAVAVLTAIALFVYLEVSLP